MIIVKNFHCKKDFNLTDCPIRKTFWLTPSCSSVNIYTVFILLSSLGAYLIFGHFKGRLFERGAYLRGALIRGRTLIRGGRLFEGGRSFERGAYSREGT